MKNESVKDIIDKAKQDHKLYGVTPPGPWPAPPKDWMAGNGNSKKASLCEDSQTAIEKAKNYSR